MKHSLFKKFGATFVALTLAFSSASAVSAAGDTSEFQPKVTYSNGNYTFAMGIILLPSYLIRTKQYLHQMVLLIT